MRGQIDEQLQGTISEQLAGQFKGDIIGPDHAEYERARTVWNAMIDRRPGLILRCTSTSDVVAAVTVAREHGLPPSVRCGGHNVAGKAMSEVLVQRKMRPGRRSIMAFQTVRACSYSAWSGPMMSPLNCPASCSATRSRNCSSIVDGTLEDDVVTDIRVFLSV